MISIVHSIYSQSVHAPALDAGFMDNDAERYCNHVSLLCKDLIIDIPVYSILYSQYLQLCQNYHLHMDIHRVA